MATQEQFHIAVVVGYHSYEVRRFQDFFMAMPGLHPYIQHLEQFTSSTQAVRQSYDAVLFYIMREDTPVNDGPWYEGRALEALGRLGETDQGIFMLHHSLLAFPRWPVWRRVCGVNPDTYQTYALDQELAFSIADRTHPITRGLQDFTLRDEAYQMGPADPGAHVLLRCHTPHNIATAAWLHRYQNSNVVCCQPGHGPSAWEHPAFRQVVHQGLLWLCRHRGGEA